MFWKFKKKAFKKIIGTCFILNEWTRKKLLKFWESIKYYIIKMKSFILVASYANQTWIIDRTIDEKRMKTTPSQYRPF